jgi:hypothetical protein
MKVNKISAVLGTTPLLLALPLALLLALLPATLASAAPPATPSPQDLANAIYNHSQAISSTKNVAPSDVTAVLDSSFNAIPNTKERAYELFNQIGVMPAAPTSALVHNTVTNALFCVTFSAHQGSLLSAGPSTDSCPPQPLISTAATLARANALSVAVAAVQIASNYGSAPLAVDVTSALRDYAPTLQMKVLSTTSFSQPTGAVVNFQENFVTVTTNVCVRMPRSVGGNPQIVVCPDPAPVSPLSHGVLRSTLWVLSEPGNLLDQGLGTAKHPPVVYPHPLKPTSQSSAHAIGLNQNSAEVAWTSPSLGIVRVDFSSYQGTSCSSPTHVGSSTYKASDNLASGFVTLSGPKWFSAPGSYSATVTLTNVAGSYTTPCFQLGINTNHPTTTSPVTTSPVTTSPVTTSPVTTSPGSVAPPTTFPGTPVTQPTTVSTNPPTQSTTSSITGKVYSINQNTVEVLWLSSYSAVTKVALTVYSDAACSRSAHSGSVGYDASANTHSGYVTLTGPGWFSAAQTYYALLTVTTAYGAHQSGCFLVGRS